MNFVRTSKPKPETGEAIKNPVLGRDCVMYAFDGISKCKGSN
jgi:hypothetical protein